MDNKELKQKIKDIFIYNDTFENELDQFQILKNETIKTVEPSKHVEGIIDVVLDSGISYTLFGTDLGCWIGNFYNPNIKMHSLTDIIEKYNFLIDYEYMDIDPEVIVQDDNLIISYWKEDEICYIEYKFSELKEDVLNIINKPDGCKCLEDSLAVGFFFISK